MESNTQLGVIVDEFKSENVKRRANSVKQILVLAQAFGPARTRSELVPFLSELLDDEDEVIIQLTEILADLGDLIGGMQHAAILLPTFERLCYSEDAGIRDKNIENVCKILSRMDYKANGPAILAMLKKISVGDFHSSKISAAAIIPHVFPNFQPDKQNELVG